MLRRYLPLEDQQALLRTVGQFSDVFARRDHAWIQALLLSGLRIHEFSLITLGDAQAALKSKYLFIPAEHRKGSAVRDKEGQLKKIVRHDHQVFVTQALRLALQKLVDIRFEMTGGATIEMGSPLVVSRNQSKGQPMTVRSYELRLKHWAVMAGLSAAISPHWLRHTRAMNIMRQSEATDPRGVVQMTLGHASISSTGIYTGILVEEMERALTRTDALPDKRVSLAQLRRAYEAR